MPKSAEIYRLVVNPADGKMYATVRDLTTDTQFIYRTVNPVQ
jgi:hypothetical protein